MPASGAAEKIGAAPSFVREGAAGQAQAAEIAVGFRVHEGTYANLKASKIFEQKCSRVRQMEQKTGFFFRNSVHAK